MGAAPGEDPGGVVASGHTSGRMCLRDKPPEVIFSPVTNKNTAAASADRLQARADRMKEDRAKRIAALNARMDAEAAARAAAPQVAPVKKWWK